MSGRRSGTDSALRGMAGGLTRRALLAAAAGTSMATAGCLDVLNGDDGGGGRPEELVAVPEEVDGMLFTDDAFLDDETTRTLIDGIVEAGSGVRGRSYAELLVAVARSGEIGYESSLAFYKTDSEAGYLGLLMRTDGSSEETVALVRETGGEFEETTQGDRTVYDGMAGSKTARVVALNDNLVAIGTAAGVDAAIATHDGDASAIGGALRAGYQQAGDGNLKATLDIKGDELEAAGRGIAPTLGTAISVLPTINVLTGTYSSGAEAMLELQLSMDDGRDAENAAQSLQGLIEAESAGTENESTRSEVPVDERPLLQRVSVGQSGRYLTVSLPTTAAEVRGYFESYSETLAAELGNEQASSTGG